MELLYSDVYNESDFNEFEEFDSKKRYRQKSLEATALIILGFLGVITSWFAKGYFTKIGELTAEGHYKKYQIFKDKISEIVFKNENPIFGIQFEYKKGLIRIFYKADNEQNFKKQLDLTKNIHDKLINFYDSQDKEIKMLTLTLRNSEIIDFFFVDINNDIYSFNN